jgi:hypothetical protein
VVLLNTGAGRPLKYESPTADRSVQVSADEFEEALQRLVLEVPLSLRPAQAGRLVRASSHGATLDTVWRSALHRDYGRWCGAHHAPSDCLSLLEDGLGLTATDKLTVALGLSMEPMREGIANAVEATLTPHFFYAVIVTGLASWVALAAVPEPVFTKAAAVLAGVLLAYVGVAQFLEVVKACFTFKQATDRATTFEELDEAGQRFGRVLGVNGARVFILAVTVLVSKGTAEGAAWLASRLPLLPGFSEAAALGASQVGFRLENVGQLSAVAVVDGTVAVTLAPTAVAMAALGPGSDGIQGDTEGQVHHICTDKNEQSPAKGGPWTQRFQRLFAKAGMTLKDRANLIRIRGHEGAHPEEYHREVYRRIDYALRNCKGASQCQEVLLEELNRLAKELMTPGNELRQWVTKGKGG